MGEFLKEMGREVKNHIFRSILACTNSTTMAFHAKVAFNITAPSMKDITYLRDPTENKKTPSGFTGIILHNFH